jgi:hypothetical protein
MSRYDDELDQQEEAVRSLGEFHPGTWRGTARSFSVTQDVAAGIVHRRSVPYQVSVSVEPAILFHDHQLTETYRKLDYEEKDDGDSNKVISYMQEPSSETEVPPSSSRTTRTVLLGSSCVDVDSVDASYSLDQSVPDLPRWLVGRRNTLTRTRSDNRKPFDDDDENNDDLEDHEMIEFGIEHCVATGTNERVRSFLLYGGEPHHQLLRVVVCHEERVLGKKADDDIALRDAAPVPSLASSLTAADLLEMQSDIDRLVDRIVNHLPTTGGRGGATAAAVPEGILTSGKRSDPNNHRNIHIYDQIKERKQSQSARNSPLEQSEPRLSLHTTSLLEASSGVWLGDAVIRQVQQRSVDEPVSSSLRPRGANPWRGFSQAGSATRVRDRSPASVVAARRSWEVGVQKVAWRWMWNFGDEIRQLVDAGRSLGSVRFDPALTLSLGGYVCVNEGLRRRVPPADRMVYIDWTGDNVGFLVGLGRRGSTYIQAPRFHDFDRTRDGIRPFYTDFCVFFEQQSDYDSSSDAEPTGGEEDDNAPPSLPSLLCSKISRVYSSNGSLKQGYTGFYSFKRFGGESEDPRELQ